MRGELRKFCLPKDKSQLAGGKLRGKIHWASEGEQKHSKGQEAGRGWHEI